MTLMESMNFEKITVCDEMLTTKSDSFRVAMEPFSHLTNKDLIFYSRFDLPRSLSRKGSQIGEEKKMNRPIIDNERDAISSPRAVILVADVTSEKSMSIDRLVDHQIINITSGVVATVTPNSTRTPTKSKLIRKTSNSLKQRSVINPRGVAFFFATLSSVGTILLIYFSLSIPNYNGDYNMLDY